MWPRIFSLLFKQLPIVKCSFQIRFPDKELGWNYYQLLTGGSDSFELLSEEVDASDSWILRRCWIGSSGVWIRVNVNRRNVCKTHHFDKNWMKHRDVLAPGSSWTDPGWNTQRVLFRSVITASTKAWTSWRRWSHSLLEPFIKTWNLFPNPLRFS